MGDDWTRWWKDPETRTLHFIGKDNIVFHCIVFLRCFTADGTYNLPDNVPANEFLNLEDDKISTSRNWAVWLHEYLRELPGKQDTLRYVLTANAPETKDNNFTWKDFRTRNNSELVAILGNFINRAVVLMGKYYGGEVPEAYELTEFDRRTTEEVRRAAEAVGLQPRQLQVPRGSARSHVTWHALKTNTLQIPNRGSLSRQTLNA